jgi:hypothetical protein
MSPNTTPAITFSVPVALQNNNTVSAGTGVGAGNVRCQPGDTIVWRSDSQFTVSVQALGTEPPGPNSPARPIAGQPPPAWPFDQAPPAAPDTRFTGTVRAEVPPGSIYKYKITIKVQNQDVVLDPIIIVDKKT